MQPGAPDDTGEADGLIHRPELPGLPVLLTEPAQLPLDLGGHGRNPRYHRESVSTDSSSGRLCSLAMLAHAGQSSRLTVPKSVCACNVATTGVFSQIPGLPACKMSQGQSQGKKVRPPVIIALPSSGWPG